VGAGTTAKHKKTLQRTLRRSESHCIARMTYLLRRKSGSRDPLQRTVTHCSTLQHTTTYCCTLQHIAAYYKALQHMFDIHIDIHIYISICIYILYIYTRVHIFIFAYTFVCVCIYICNTLQHMFDIPLFVQEREQKPSATYCYTLQPFATYCNTLQTAT